MKLFLAVTDSTWFRFLRSRPEIDEVNFWQPGGNREFKALRPGQPFLFKLHSPENFVVGGGFFAHASLLPATLAWEAFGDKNGAATWEEMRARIQKYRRRELEPREDPTIGCIVLTQPFFFDEIDWIQMPGDFQLSTVVGKGYDTREGEGRKLWERVSALLRSLQPMAVAEPQEEMFGEPILVRPRLGQGSFRVLVTDIYRRRCAISGERALPVLQAAHIRPVANGGQHRIDNGLLLRSDIHTLFDRGYISVTPEHRILVSRKLKEEFDNGEPYYPLQGKEIWLPPTADERPRSEFLEWHSDSVFRS
jgi:putative restriction endonuclease